MPNACFLGHCEFPPLRLLLGSYAVESIRDRLRSIIEEIEDWKHLSFPADSDAEPQVKSEEKGDEKADDEAEPEENPGS